ncbi:hypothetical protein [Methanoregula sp.]|jgi:hypothetical protein|uniref:hypothetical protein n=1 Tax=Methanoregula sp. TaxID=2052170 RepID=UPI003565960A
MTRLLAPGGGYEIINYPTCEIKDDDNNTSFLHITPEAWQNANVIITSIRQNRGKFISGCVDVENYLGQAISYFFFKEDPTNREMLHNFILDTTVFSFSQKRKVLQRIMETYPERFESFSNQSRQEMFDKINYLIKTRNIFAHGEMIIDFKEDKAYLRYYDSMTNQKAEIIVSMELFESLKKKTEAVISDLLIIIPEPRFTAMRFG